MATQNTPTHPDCAQQEGVRLCSHSRFVLSYVRLLREALAHLRQLRQLWFALDDAILTRSSLTREQLVGAFSGSRIHGAQHVVSSIDSGERDVTVRLAEFTAPSYLSCAMLLVECRVITRVLYFAFLSNWLSCVSFTSNCTCLAQIRPSLIAAQVCFH